MYFFNVPQTFYNVLNMQKKKAAILRGSTHKH